MRSLKRLVVLAVSFTFAMILLVWISDVDPGEYVHPAGRMARAARWRSSESSDVVYVEDALAASNTTRLKKSYVREVRSP